MSKSKKKHSQRRPILFVLLGFVSLGLIVSMLLRGNDVILFNPKGLVASEQHRLMVTATLIMLGFGAVVLFFLYFFAWKYRETNHKAVHDPHAGRSKLLVFTAWASPFVIFLILASLMIPATFRLEPQDKIEAAKDPLTVQVVALRWKWLFIYPEQSIATVNYLQLPVDTPVRFELTADEAPMNSFWIPHLGGQLYAMTEHVNQLNLLPDTIGEYQGSAAEINGIGFAGMRFKTHVTTQEDFDEWAEETRSSQGELSQEEYAKLLEPNENYPPTFFGEPDPKIYSGILSKYGESHGGHSHNVEIKEYEAH